MSAEPTFSLNVQVTLTQSQWAKFLRIWGQRKQFCAMGMDDPQMDDFVMFQVLQAMRTELARRGSKELAPSKENQLENKDHG